MFEAGHRRVLEIARRQNAGRQSSRDPLLDQCQIAEARLLMGHAGQRKISIPYSRERPGDRPRHAGKLTYRFQFGKAGHIQGRPDRRLDILGSRRSAKPAREACSQKRQCDDLKTCLRSPGCRQPSHAEGQGTFDDDSPPVHGWPDRVVSITDSFNADLDAVRTAVGTPIHFSCYHHMGRRVSEPTVRVPQRGANVQTGAHRTASG
jgi:hypothetical protein